MTFEEVLESSRKAEKVQGLIDFVSAIDISPSDMKAKLIEVLENNRPPAIKLPTPDRAKAIDLREVINEIRAISAGIYRGNNG